MTIHRFVKKILAARNSVDDTPIFPQYVGTEEAMSIAKTWQPEPPYPCGVIRAALPAADKNRSILIGDDGLWIGGREILLYSEIRSWDHPKKEPLPNCLNVVRIDGRTCLIPLPPSGQPFAMMQFLSRAMWVVGKQPAPP